jgi:hypothetical protein
VATNGRVGAAPAKAGRRQKVSGFGDAVESRNAAEGLVADWVRDAMGESGKPGEMVEEQEKLHSY